MSKYYLKIYISEEAKKSAYLHGDETGWRVNGQTHWLWCFCNKNLTWYIIDKSRGSPALQRFFEEIFQGVLITDFWKAYKKIVSVHQACYSHLFRELAKVTERNKSEEWIAFRKRLVRWMRDAMRLAARVIKSINSIYFLTELKKSIRICCYKTNIKSNFSYTLYILLLNSSHRRQ